MFITHTILKKYHTKIICLIFFFLTYNASASMEDFARRLVEIGDTADYDALITESEQFILKHGANQSGISVLLQQSKDLAQGLKFQSEKSYDPKQAKHYLQRASMGVNEGIIVMAQDSLATLLREHFSKEDNSAHAQAESIFDDLNNKGFSEGAVGKALYAMDRQEYGKAYTLLEHALTLEECNGSVGTSKLEARLWLACLWENGLIPGKKADLKQTCRLLDQLDSYTSTGLRKLNVPEKVKEELRKFFTVGKLSKARLVLTNKLPGNKEEKEKAENTIREEAEKDSEAAILFGCHLIMNGKNSEGIAYLEKSLVGDFDAIYLAKLQLGMLYSLGYGVEQDTEKGQNYFADIIKYREHNPASKFTYGCMQYYGLGGVIANRELALKRIRANIDHISVNNTVPFRAFFYQINAEIEQLKEQEAVEAQAVLVKKNAEDNKKCYEAGQELIDAEERSATKKNKAKATAMPTKGKNKRSKNKIKAVACMMQATTSSQGEHESLAPSTEIKVDQQDIKGILGTTEVWNDDFFPTSDSSTVERIDYGKRMIVVDDPKMKEKLFFIVTEDLHKTRRVIPPFRYHERIALRQGDEVSARTAYNHSFAQKLDYIMQQFGRHIPVVNIRGKTDEALSGSVVRQTKDGQLIVCKAEYTFGRNDNDVYVYHRLLRPITDKKEIARILEQYFSAL